MPNFYHFRLVWDYMYQAYIGGSSIFLVYSMITCVCMETGTLVFNGKIQDTQLFAFVFFYFFARTSDGIMSFPTTDDRRHFPAKRPTTQQQQRRTVSCYTAFLLSPSSFLEIQQQQQQQQQQQVLGLTIAALLLAARGSTASSSSSNSSKQQRSAHTAARIGSCRTQPAEQSACINAVSYR